MVTSNLLYHAQSFRVRASRMGETVSLGTHGSGEELMMMVMDIIVFVIFMMMLISYVNVKVMMGANIYILYEKCLRLFLDLHT